MHYYVDYKYGKNWLPSMVASKKALIDLFGNKAERDNPEGFYELKGTQYRVYKAEE